MSTRDDPVGTPSVCRWTAGRPDSCPPVVEEPARSAAADVVLPIRPRSTYVDGAPLFCLPGEAVLAWNYVGLVAHLDPRVPIYGLQACDESRTIREYAARYLAEIRRISPHGPYQLLGWSAGGFVAHEVAVRLRAAGEQVRVVALATDPAAPIPAPLSGARFDRLFGTAAITAGLAGTLALTGSDLARIVHLSTVAARMVPAYRPSWLPGDLIVCIARRAPDGTDRLDPAATVRNWRPYVEGPVTGFLLDASADELTAPDVLPEIARILTATRSATARTT